MAVSSNKLIKLGFFVECSTAKGVVLVPFCTLLDAINLGVLRHPHYVGCPKNGVLGIPELETTLFSEGPPAPGPETEADVLTY